MRVVQPEGTRGSLKWIQRAVERRPDLIQPPALPPVTWLSPLRTDAFAEYRDAAFLTRLGLAHHAKALADFWPRRGPQWDALGVAGDAVVLVEAKAHVDEFLSPPSQAGAASRARIAAAFDRVKTGLDVGVAIDWSGTLYQYTNRLAHLWWLRERGVPAHLVFISFLGDPDMGGPVHAETWDAAFRVADAALGLRRRHALSAYVHHLTPSVSELG